MTYTKTMTNQVQTWSWNDTKICVKANLTPYNQQNDLEIQGVKKSQKDTQGMEYERHYQN